MVELRAFILSSYKLPKKNIYKKGKICAEIALSKGYSKEQIISVLEDIKINRGFRNGILNYLQDH